MMLLIAVACTALFLLSSSVVSAQSSGKPLVVAASQAEAPAQQKSDEREPTPEERMASRFPQPVKAGDLIGLAVLDWRDSTIGFVADVVRTPAGQIKLIVRYRKYFGWLPGVDWGRRPVAVPIEAVAMLGRQIAALDMPREDFESAPAFTQPAGKISPGETLRIAITRR